MKIMNLIKNHKSYHNVIKNQNLIVLHSMTVDRYINLSSIFVFLFLAYHLMVVNL